MPKPKSKNDTWSEKELEAVLKQAGGNTSKSSGQGREHGSKDKRSSSSVKGAGEKEGGQRKKDSTIAKGEGAGGQTTAVASGSSKEKMRQTSTGKSPFTGLPPARKTKDRDPSSKEKVKHSSSSKGESGRKGEEEGRKESKQRSKDEEGRRKEGGREGQRKDQSKLRKSEKSSKSDSKLAVKSEEQLKAEERRKSKHRLEKEGSSGRMKVASGGKPSRGKVPSGAELAVPSSDLLPAAGSEGSVGHSSKSGRGDQEERRRRREEELLLAGELSEGTTSDEEEEDHFITDPTEQKQSALATVQPMVEVVNSEEVTEEVNYEDEEFEDYDQDFDEEEEEESEEGSPQGESEEDTNQVEEIMDAINAENVKVTSSGWLGLPKGGSPSLEEAEVGSGPLITRSPQRRVFIDFSSVKRVKVDAKTARKIRRRGKELLELIELDVTGHDMFDLPPMTEYEIYMRSFGQRDARQVAVETGEDTMDTDAQTDHIDTRDVWTQHPAEGVAVGGADGVEEGSFDVEFTTAADSLRLTHFLSTAGRVMSILLEEERTITNEQGSPHNTQQGRSTLAFSTGYTKLSSTYSFLGGRHWVDLGFSPVRDDVMLMMLSPAATRSWTGISSKGILCLWDIREPTHPERLLVTEGSPTCCCLGSGRVPLAFVGMEDGSLDVWDLRESPVHGLLGEEVGWAGHLPCYSTARVLAEEGHRSAVACVTVVGVQGGREGGSVSEAPKMAASMGSDSSVLGLSYQLASVDVSGRVVVWVVAEVTHPDPHGSETDFGLSPGGRVKLVCSACVDLSSPKPRSFALTSTITTHCLVFHPRQANHYYVGTDEGMVLHCQRYGKKPMPRFYQKDPDHVTDVTAIAFSPWQPDHFLVGCSDGIICLYHCDHGNPLLSWTRSTHGHAVHKMLWSHDRPGVFVVLDDASTVHLWDLLENDAGPVNKAESTNMKIASIALSPHSKRQRTVLVLSFEDGSVETHHLSEQYSSPKEGEEGDFEEYLLSLVM